MRPALGIAASTAVGLALALGPAVLAAPASPGRAHDVTVTVTAKDYSFALSTKSSVTGKVTFSVKNSGKHDHTFQIAGKKTSVLKPGKSAKLAVRPRADGRIEGPETIELELLPGADYTPSLFSQVSIELQSQDGAKEKGHR